MDQILLFCYELLSSRSDHGKWIHYDFYLVAKMVLSKSQFIQWQMWLGDEARENSVLSAG